VLRAVVETGNTEEDIQDWLQLDEGDTGFQHLTEEETAAVTFYLFSSALSILLNFSLIYFLRYFFVF
jgi:hypothetical protein